MRSPVLAALTAGLLVVPATPAHAERVCMAVAGTPSLTISGQVHGEGRRFCVGWGGNKVRTRTRVEYQTGAGDVKRWLTAPHAASSIGERSSYTAYRMQGQRKYRTRTLVEVIGNHGIVIKRYGWDQSPAVTL